MINQWKHVNIWSLEVSTNTLAYFLPESLYDRYLVGLQCPMGNDLERFSDLFNLCHKQPNQSVCLFVGNIYVINSPTNPSVCSWGTSISLTAQLIRLSVCQEHQCHEWFNQSVCLFVRNIYIIKCWIHLSVCGEYVYHKWLNQSVCLFVGNIYVMNGPTNLSVCSWGTSIS